MRFMMMMKSDEASESGAMPSNELVAAMMKYNQDLIDSGALLAGEGLHASSRGAVIKFHKGQPTVTDGPFAEAKELIAGYWVIEAASRAEAEAWALRIPFEAAADTSDGEGTVEVRPLYELEDFPVSENESGWREQEEAHRAKGWFVNQPVPGREQYMILRMADAETEAETMPVGEAGEELFAAMGAYNEEMIAAGVMLAGDGLRSSKEGFKLKYRNGKRTIVDGPFTEAKELIAGFTLIQVASRDEALEWVRRWPPLDANGEVELRLRQVFTADEFGEQLPDDLREEGERLRRQAAGDRG